MSRYLSPLRYPGGKTRMAGFLAHTFDHLPSVMDVEIWLEPFGGGAGAALKALRDHDVPEAWIVEANPALAAFWKVAVNDPYDMAAWVENTAPSLPVFYAARDTVEASLAGESVDTVALARAAFIVNRCSRSGMLVPGVGPMGGKAQSGATKLTDRWNPTGLAARLRALAPLSDRITVHAGDGIAFLEDLPDSGIVDEVFVFADPPYIGAGNALYARGMDDDLHSRLARALHALPHWVLTYDAHPKVVQLYEGMEIAEFDIPHSAGRSRIGKEFLVCPPNTPRASGNPLGKGSIRPALI